MGMVFLGIGVYRRNPSLPILASGDADVNRLFDGIEKKNETADRYFKEPRAK